MVKLNVLSIDFAHDKGSTANKAPLNIEWCFFTYENHISVYLHNDVFKGIEDHKNDGGDKLKFLWLLESKMYSVDTVGNIKNNLSDVLETYEQIWTHNDELLSLHPKFKWTPAYGCFVRDFGIHPKTKTVSMISSNKTHTPQQLFRYNFAIDNVDKIDVFGNGIQHISFKEEGLNDYMFSFAFENVTYDTYFTEKILDCFATGTIPIYLGTKRVAEHFNSDGIIFFEEGFDVSMLTRELYESKMEAIIDNYNRVQQYSILDDWIYERHLKNYLFEKPIDNPSGPKRSTRRKVSRCRR